MVSTLIPRILPQQKIQIEPYGQLETQQAFNLFGDKFSQLADAAEYEALKNHLLEMDIAEERTLLDQSPYECTFLEIAVPVFGVVDLFHSNVFSNMQSFASVIKLDGFSQRADFVLITDIAGHQYEILVGPQGEITLPQEGTGLFSIPSKITFIFSDSKHSMQPSKLFLLPPAEMSANFKFYISVSHINEKMQRRVDSIRSVKVRYAVAPHLNKALLLSFTEALYSKAELIKDYFSGERFSFSQRFGFNHFLLQEETFDVLYDKILYDLIHQRLPQSFVSECTNPERSNPVMINHFQPLGVFAQLPPQTTESKFKRK